MSASVPIRVGEVQAWMGGDAVVVGVGRRVALSGGGTAPLVERVSVQYEQSGRVDEVDLVAKRATPAEVAALRCLDVVDPVFPQLIDSGADDDGPWLVVPFQPGESIGWMTEPPGSVYAALARLHLRHLGRTDELPPQIPRVDEQFLRSTFTRFAPSGIDRAARQAPHPVHERALDLLARFADDERLRIGLEVLPATLLHGDVYGDNVVAASPGPGATGVPQLIDWGSARIGPAMLDVMMAGGPAGVAAYKEAWIASTGTAMDEWQAATGEAWATAVSNAMFSARMLNARRRLLPSCSTVPRKPSIASAGNSLATAGWRVTTTHALADRLARTERRWKRQWWSGR